MAIQIAAGIIIAVVVLSVGGVLLTLGLELVGSLLDHLCQPAYLRFGKRSKKVMLSFKWGWVWLFGILIGAYLVACASYWLPGHH